MSKHRQNESTSWTCGSKWHQLPLCWEGEAMSLWDLDLRLCPHVLLGQQFGKTVKAKGFYLTDCDLCGLLPRTAESLAGRRDYVKDQGIGLRRGACHVECWLYNRGRAGAGLQHPNLIDSKAHLGKSFIYRPSDVIQSRAGKLQRTWEADHSLVLKCLIFYRMTMTVHHRCVCACECACVLFNPL